MALPESVSSAALVTPFARPLRLSARITSPLATESDSYLGGFASGNRLAYLDAMHFVWWTPNAMPAPTPVEGYGSGAYGAGPYGEPAPAAGYGSSEYGSGAYGGMSGFGSDPFGRGPYGGG